MPLILRSDADRGMLQNMLHPIRCLCYHHTTSCTNRLMLRAVTCPPSFRYRCSQTRLAFLPCSCASAPRVTQDYEKLHEMGRTPWSRFPMDLKAALERSSEPPPHPGPDRVVGGDASERHRHKEAEKQRSATHRCRRPWQRPSYRSCCS